MKYKMPRQVAETLLTVAVWVTVAALAATIFVLGAAIVNAGPLADRYDTLAEAGMLDYSHNGLVAVEPAEVTVDVLVGLVEAGKVDIEQVDDTVWVVRMPIDDDRGAIWHAVVFGETEEDELQAAIYVIGHELPAQPA